MASLAEIQASIGQALLDPDAPVGSELLSVLAPGASRLEIHRRNYEVSLVEALTRKFPATEWLLGLAFLEQSARAFVREYPPESPCISEYGWRFPGFLASLPHAAGLPYLNDFMMLEWWVGLASIAVGRAATDHPFPAGADPVDLQQVEFQPGVYYLGTAWPVDTLLGHYVHQSAPAQLIFEPEWIWLEVQGTRGSVETRRLDEPEFVFRKALKEGMPLGEAADRASAVDPEFDIDRASARLAVTDLVIDRQTVHTEEKQS